MLNGWPFSFWMSDSQSWVRSAQDAFYRVFQCADDLHSHPIRGNPCKSGGWHVFMHRLNRASWMGLWLFSVRLHRLVFALSPISAVSHFFVESSPEVGEGFAHCFVVFRRHGRDVPRPCRAVFRRLAAMFFSSFSFCCCVMLSFEYPNPLDKVTIPSIQRASFKRATSFNSGFAQVMPDEDFPPASQAGMAFP